MFRRIEHCFTSIKNLINQCIWLNSAKHQRNVKVCVILRYIGSLKGLPKLGNPLDKVMAKIKKTEKTEPTAAETVQANTPNNVYLKALPLRALEDVSIVKREVNSGNILILKVSPLAKKSIDDVKQAVREVTEFTPPVAREIAD